MKISLWGAVIGALLVGPGSAWAAKTTPTFYTTASPTTNVGLQIFDHANLSGSVAPTGSIAFTLYGPADTTCQTPVFSSTVPISGTGSDDSQRYTAPAAGTYRWIAAYGGDANNNPVASGCGAVSQSVIVSKVMPVAKLSAGSGTDGRIHAVATLAGGFTPVTGTITFTVTGPNDQFCGGSAVYTATVPVGGAGSYDSGWFAPTAAGTYTYRIRYAGDTNNYGIGPTGCTQAGDSVTVTSVPTPTPSPTPLALGSPTAVSGPAAVSGLAAVAAPTRIAFHSPTHCVRSPFRVWVDGTKVSRVTYYLHGRRIRTVTRADRRGRFVATVNPRGLRRGARERLTAHVAAGPGTHVLARTFVVCS